MKIGKIISVWIILFMASATNVLLSADIRIDASAPAKSIRFRNFYGGYIHNNFYFEQSGIYKNAHDILRAHEHKRPLLTTVRLLNIYTYYHENGSLKNYSEIRSGHCYDTDMYPETGGYNWEKVNAVFDELKRAKLTPMVNFICTPECMASDLSEIGNFGLGNISPPNNYNEWADLVKNTILHLQDRYGVQEIRKWYFHPWNEPDYNEFMRAGYNEFLKIYDYSVGPVKEVDSQIVVGGPDNAGSNPTDFLNHVSAEKNYYNGTTGSALDYFSIHAYKTTTRGFVDKAWDMCEYVKSAFPNSYQDKDLLITEAAPAWYSRWHVHHTRYTPAWMASIIDVFLEGADIHGEYYLPKMIYYMNFIRGYGKQSIFVHLDDVTSLVDSDEILKTPYFNFLEMLSMLSEERLSVAGVDLPTGLTNIGSSPSITFDQVRCLATRTPGQSIEALIYHFNQTNKLVYNEVDNKGSDNIWGQYYSDSPERHSANLIINNIPYAKVRYKKYIIDKEHSNATAYYHTHGEPNNYALLDQYDDLEEVENNVINITNGTYTENITIEENSVILVVLENMNIEPGPHLGLSVNYLDFGSGAYTTKKEISISNYGDQDLTWMASENPEQAWITSIVPSSGVVSPGENTQVTVTVDRSGLDDLGYNGQIVFSSNGGEKEVDITIHGTPPLPDVYRVNVAGSAYTDRNGNEWAADKQYTSGSFGFIGGKTSSTTDPIARTDDDFLYQTERYYVEAYHFDVPNGNYLVNLHFVEMYFNQANGRLMDVSIEGEQKLSNFDIFSEVGHDAALVKSYSNVVVNDGRLDIAFSASANASQVCAIEVINMRKVNPDADYNSPASPTGVQLRKVP